jgi:N terminus of Rad21 / Rec8 like protein
MFYSHLILTKKGALGFVWMAATLGERAVTKRYASTVKISALCRSIHTPDAPFALRLSAQLLLGVARVFARKSALVLADTNNLLHALQRYTVPQLSQTSSRKRARGEVSIDPSCRHHPRGTNEPISLAPSDQGDLSRITISCGKKRRIETRAAATVDDGKDLSPIGLSRNAPSDPLFTHWLESQPEFDMEAAIEMAFPSITFNKNRVSGGKGFEAGSSDGGGIERHISYSGDPKNSIRNTVTSKSSSDTHKGSTFTYRARPQDITLPLSEQYPRLSDSALMIGSVGRQIDDNVSLGLRQDISLSDSHNDDRSIGQEPRAESFDATGSGKFSQGEPHSGLVEPDAADFQSAFAQGIRIRHESHREKNRSPVVSFTDDPSLYVPGQKSTRAETQLPRFLNPTLRHEQGDASHAEMLHPNLSTESDVIETSAHRGLPSGARPPRAPSSLKKGLRAETFGLIDPITELSIMHMRDCLADTSSIVMVNGKHHGKKTNSAAQTEDAIARAYVWSSFLDESAPELRLMWEKLIAGPELMDIAVMRGTVDRAGVMKDAICDKRFDQGRVPGGVDMDVSKSIGCVHGLDSNSIEDPMTLLSGGHHSFSPQSIAQVEGENGALQPLSQHTPTASQQIPPSTPSYKIATGSQARLLEPERQRNALIEEITEADRTAFEVARRLFPGGGISTSSGLLALLQHCPVCFHKHTCI